METKYVPSKESIAFIAFIRACGVEDNTSPEIHYKLADKYFSKDRKVVIESFRGSAKSTLIEWYIIYAAVLGKVHNFGEVNFIAFVGDSAENGVKNMFRNLVTKIDKSVFLQQYITIGRKTDSEMEITNKGGKELLVKGYGAKTNIRGVRYRGHRPDIVVLDDITTNDSMTSEVIQQTLNDNFYKSILPALHPTKYKVFFIGTPISERDILHQLANNDAWTVHKFPLCEKYPCSKEDFKGNWEDRFPYEAVKEKYDMYKGSGELRSFYQEYMLELTDLSTLLVEENDIKWYDPSVVYKNKGNYNFYISTDFATSENSTADYSTIGVWAINNKGDWMLADGICKRQTMDKNLDDMFKLVQIYRPLGVGVEISGQQGGFIQWIEKEMGTRNIYFNLASKIGSNTIGIRPTKSKLERFVTGVQSRFKQKRVWFPKQVAKIELGVLVEEMTDELSKLTMASGVKALKHDDAIDLLNQLSEMETITPAEDTTYAYDEENDLWGEEDTEDSSQSSYVF